MENHMKYLHISRTDEEGDENNSNEIHLHCSQCYKSNCLKFPQCALVHCIHCSTKFHKCKQKEHAIVCRQQPRPCVNRINGCPYELNSVAMMRHLEVCPASVVHCGMSWNRNPLFPRSRQQWLPFRERNPVQVAGDLDTELALSDQKHLHTEILTRMRKGRHRLSDKEHRVSDQGTIGRIDRSRLRKLESLLQNRSSIEDIGRNEISKSKYELTSSNHKQKHNHDETSADGDEEYPFVSYHEAVTTTQCDIATFVTNRSYARNTATASQSNGGHYICELITRIEPNCKHRYKEQRVDLSEEEKQHRLRVYSQYDVTFKQLGLNVKLEKLPKFPRRYPLYNFSCSKVFRRDQYPWHVGNVHNDIQDNINGTMFTRCPLAQYGCPYLQFRLTPQLGMVRFHRPFSTFTATFDAGSPCPVVRSDTLTLFDLHYDILLYLVSFLDNMSINCLAKTCRTFKGICYEVLDRQGIVVPMWSKKTYANGSSSWQIEKMVKLFTTGCSPIRKWVHTDTHAMGQHLKNCAFFKRPKMDRSRVKLPVSGSSSIDIPSILNMSERNSNYELVN